MRAKGGWEKIEDERRPSKQTGRQAYVVVPKRGLLNLYAPGSLPS